MKYVAYFSKPFHSFVRFFCLLLMKIFFEKKKIYIYHSSECHNNWNPMSLPTIDNGNYRGSGVLTFSTTEAELGSWQSPWL